MDPRRPIPLYPNPPYTHDEVLLDASSDPIRVRESSPDPVVRSLSQSCRRFFDSPVRTVLSASRHSRHAILDR